MLRAVRRFTLLSLALVAVGAIAGAADPDCPDAQALCSDSGAPLAASEAEMLARGAASSLPGQSMTVAVVDRAGRPLAVFRQLQAPPGDAEVAVGLARTGAFFSHNQAPLSSRTVRYISGIHFPPRIRRTPTVALYGIEATNRGCDLNVAFNPGRCVPAARSILRDGPCNAFDASGCGSGIVTGKFSDPFSPSEEELGDSFLSVHPGGLPLFRPGGSGPLGLSLVGGLGVAGVAPGAAEYAAFTAARGQGFFVEFRADRGEVVFLDGIRLPFVDPREWPRELGGGTEEGEFIVAPRDGGCAAERYLAGPRNGATLSRVEVDRIVRQSVAAANETRAAIRLPLGSPSRMVIAVADVEGEILALYRMRDATVFSIDVAVAKARNVVWFSSAGVADLPGMEPGTAVNNRTISFGAQPLFPPGLDVTRSEGGPWFELFKTSAGRPCSQGSDPAGVNQNGVVFFPGSTPLYRNGVLVGGLGISGDGVEQDDRVSFLGADGFLPEEAIRSDRLFIRGVRLPFFKFPRQPGKVTHEELKIGPEELD